MSMLKNVGIGVAGVVVLGLGYLGYKKFRGKKEDDKVSEVDKDLVKNQFTATDLQVLITEEEELIKNLENLHYSEEFIKPFRESLQNKKDLLNTAF